MTFRVVAKPGRSRDRVTWTGEELIVEVTARAHDGEANAAVIKVIAKALGMPKSKVHITRGAAARHKTVEIDADEAIVLRALDALRT